jgi:hypothetical protein
MSWLETVFARYGNPESLVSDTGPQFRSSEFEQFLESRNIRHIKSSVYTPQQNGLVENFNKYLKYGIQAFGTTSQHWEKGIEDLLTSYRASAPSANEKSPGELMFGRRIRLPFEQVRRPNQPDPAINLPTEPTTTQRPSSLPRNRGPYAKGDLVLARRPHVLKGQSPFSKPLRITEVLGQWTYLLSDGQIWNARRIRRYFPPQETDSEFVNMESPCHLRRSTRASKGQPPRRYIFESVR